MSDFCFIIAMSMIHSGAYFRILDDIKICVFFDETICTLNYKEHLKIHDHFPLITVAAEAPNLTCEDKIFEVMGAMLW